MRALCTRRGRWRRLLPGVARTIRTPTPWRPMDSSDSDHCAKVRRLAVSRDGLRLVATVEVLNGAKSRAVPQLREIPLDGVGPAVGHLRGGASRPVFRPDGSLVFVSARQGVDGAPALWVLEADGRSRLLAARAGASQRRWSLRRPARRWRSAPGSPGRRPTMTPSGSDPAGAGRECGAAHRYAGAAPVLRARHRAAATTAARG